MIKRYQILLDDWQAEYIRKLNPDKSLCGTVRDLLNVCLLEFPKERLIRTKEQSDKLAFEVRKRVTE